MNTGWGPGTQGMTRKPGNRGLRVLRVVLHCSDYSTTIQAISVWMLQAQTHGYVLYVVAIHTVYSRELGLLWAQSHGGPTKILWYGYTIVYYISSYTNIYRSMEEYKCKHWNTYLRWHSSLSAKVTKNANLGYSHDRGVVLLSGLGFL